MNFNSFLKLYFSFLFQFFVTITKGVDFNIDVAIMNNTQGFKIWNSTAADQTLLGHRAANVGDINGDHINDLIIGADGYDSNKGIAYVVYGSAGFTTNIDVDSGSFSPNHGFKIYDSTTNAPARLGYSVCSAGDVNGDNINDIIIGAYSINGQRGAAYVIYGRSSLMTDIDIGSPTFSPNQGYKIYNFLASINSFFGYFVEGIGDLNGDKIDDLLIGAHGSNGDQGVAYVVYGSSSLRTLVDVSSGFSPTYGFKIWDSTVTSSNRFGRSMSKGDVNGDQITDLLIGAFRNNGIRGAAYVIYGSTSPVTTDIDVGNFGPNQGFKIWDSTSNIDDKLGHSVSIIGDVNGDQIGDMLIGAPGVSGSGAAYVIYGSRSFMTDIDLAPGSFNLSQGFKIWDSNGNSNDQLGFALSVAGDVNGDQLNDMIIGVRNESNTGAAYIILGNTTLISELDISSTNFSSIRSFRIWDSSASASNMLGDYVGNAGDINGDQIDDVIIGAYGNNNLKGAVYVIYGQIVCSSNCLKCVIEQTCQVCLPNYVLFDSQCIEPKDNSTKSIETMTKVATTSFEATSVFASIFCIGNTISLRTGLISKIIQNTRYLNLSYSEELLAMFKTFDTNLIDPPSFKTFETHTHSKTLPFVFTLYDLPPNFILNYWQSLMMIIVASTVFVVVLLIEWILKKFSKPTCCDSILRFLRLSMLNFLLINLYQSLDDILFFSIIDFRSTFLNSFLSNLSLILSIKFTLLGVLLFYFYFRFIWKYQSLKGQGKNQNSLEAWLKQKEYLKPLFQDFKDNDWSLQIFFSLFIVRNMFAAFIFTTLFEYPLVQTLFLFVSTFILIAGLVIKKPLKELYQLLFQIFCEVLILAVNLIDLILAVLGNSKSEDAIHRERLSKGIIVINSILIFGGFGFMILEIIKTIHEIYKKWKFNQTTRKNKIRNISILKNSSQDMLMPIEATSGKINRTSFINSRVQDNARFLSIKPNLVKLGSSQTNVNNTSWASSESWNQYLWGGHFEHIFEGSQGLTSHSTKLRRLHLKDLGDSFYNPNSDKANIQGRKKINSSKTSKRISNQKVKPYAGSDEDIIKF